MSSLTQRQQEAASAWVESLINDMIIETSSGRAPLGLGGLMRSMGALVDELRAVLLSGDCDVVASNIYGSPVKGVAGKIEAQECENQGIPGQKNSGGHVAIQASVDQAKTSLTLTSSNAVSRRDWSAESQFLSVGVDESQKPAESLDSLGSQDLHEGASTTDNSQSRSCHTETSATETRTVEGLAVRRVSSDGDSVPGLPGIRFGPLPVPPASARSPQRDGLVSALLPAQQ